MRRKLYKLLGFMLLQTIFLVSLFVGITGHAAIETFTIPSRTLNVEFVYKNGTPFTEEITFDNSFFEAYTLFNQYGYQKRGTPTYNSLAITKVSNNRYQFTIPSKRISLNTSPAYYGGSFTRSGVEAEMYFSGFTKFDLSFGSSINHFNRIVLKSALTGTKFATNYTSYFDFSGNYPGKISFIKENQRMSIDYEASIGPYESAYGWKDGSKSITPDGLASLLGYSTILTTGTPLQSSGSGFYVGNDGETLQFQIFLSQIVEKYENPNGATITPPTGYTQNKATEMTSSDYTYTMANSEKLPESYLVGNTMYLYDGWYRGKGNSASRDKTHPVPEITFNASGDEEKDEVHIVYKPVNTANLIEQIRDTNGNVIESSWDKTSRKVPIGEYTTTPETERMDTQGKKWEYVGWRVGTTGEIKTTPVSQNLTTNSTTTIQYIYQEPKTTGSLLLVPDRPIVDDGSTVGWKATITNTGNSNMKELKLKRSSKWTETDNYVSGLHLPGKIIVTVDGESPKEIGVTYISEWRQGFPLKDIVLPAGKKAEITFETTVKGNNPLEILQAGLELSGNLINDVGNDCTLEASNVVRVDDPNAPTYDDEDENAGDAGFLNIFKQLDFGTATYSPSAQTKGLEGTKAPYLRLYNMDSTKPQWSLQAKLDTFKTAANKTLPTATSISFKEFQLYDINDYKKTTENVSANGAAVSEFVLPSDGTTAEVTNRLNKGYYEIRTGPNNVQLNIPAFAGLSGESYSSTLTWTLLTGP